MQSWLVPLPPYATDVLGSCGSARILQFPPPYINRHNTFKLFLMTWLFLTSNEHSFYKEGTRLKGSAIAALNNTIFLMQNNFRLNLHDKATPTVR